MSNVKRNPLEIIRKNIPKILNGGIRMIISVYEIPQSSRYTTTKRVVYHLYGGQRRSFLGIQRFIYLTREIFNINKNKVKDNISKYEIIGDADTSNSENINTYRENQINDLLYFFENKNIENKNIDTICTTNSERGNVKILYDATGHLEVGKRFVDNVNSWRRVNQAARITGNPQTLKQMGYFNKQKDDRHLIEKMRLMDLNHQEPPQRLFDFGKKVSKVSLKQLKRDLSKLK